MTKHRFAQQFAPSVFAQHGPVGDGSGWGSGCRGPVRAMVRPVLAWVVAGVGLVTLAGSAQGQTVYPVPAVPQSAAQPMGNQYVVYVPGGGSDLLTQVKQVEPTAFQTTLQGTTVIQAGRFGVYGNAQQLASTLAAQGLGASIAEVAAATPYYAQQLPVPPTNTVASVGELPPLPVPQAAPTTVPAVPTAPAGGSVEFGQELAASPVPSFAAYPVDIAPPGSSPAPVAQNAPFFVIIPTNTTDMPALSSQVIQLGTPPNQVMQRTSPRGPHVAVGPFADRGLAEEWNAFFRDAGISGSRVHYEP